MRVSHTLPSIPVSRSSLGGALTGLFLILGLFTPPSLHATSMKHRNIVDLIELSELIVVGRVIGVTDGFDQGVPFTEITLEVSETMKGTTGGVYTFRQFGLRAPRETANGLTYLAASPDGWPRFEQDEKVVLFLYKRAAQTGLRTTVGLIQGKFLQTEGRMANGIDNYGLFRNVSVGEELLSPRESKMLKAAKGSIPAEVFVSFVRKAVQNRWVETRKLDHVK